MELSRIKVLYAGLVLQLLFTIALPLPYNKYGRQCTDIGCLFSQVCVMAYDSCSLGQRDGNECGRYPTCKKKTEAGLAAGPSGVLSLNPAPENTKAKDAVYPNMPIDPNYIFGSVQTTKSPFFSNYPQPGVGSPAVFQPMYPPLNQPPPGAQVPIAFGASPQNPYYPRPQNTATTTEPSLWNQFLYNKQPDKRPRNGGPRLNSPFLLMLTACTMTLSGLFETDGPGYILVIKHFLPPTRKTKFPFSVYYPAIIPHFFTHCVGFLFLRRSNTNSCFPLSSHSFITTSTFRRKGVEAV